MSSSSPIAEEHRSTAMRRAGSPRSKSCPRSPDLCLVLGGDGIILYALRRYAGTEVPVFGINFGTIGFLAAAERDELEDGLRRAFAGDFEVMTLPGPRGWARRRGRAPRRAQRRLLHPPAARPGRRALLPVGGEEVGHVRCDGLVAATPAGSTGYNLANQGPILAWGVEGYVVSFIAPHTLTARALVVAPADRLRVGNAAGRDPVDVALDGEPSASSRRARRSRSASATASGRLAQPAGCQLLPPHPREVRAPGAVVRDRADPVQGGLMERKWWTLLATCVAMFMLLLDITIVNVALPDIQQRPGRELQRPAVGGGRLRALARGLAADGGLARRPHRPPAASSSGASRSSPSPRCSAALATNPTFLNLRAGAAGRRRRGDVRHHARADRPGVPGTGARRPPSAIWGATIGGAVAIGPLVGGALTDGSAGSGSSSSTSRSGSRRSR